MSLGSRPSRRRPVRKWGGRPAARLIAAALALYGDRCHLCGGSGADSADHVIPRSRGGPDTLDNLRPVHHRRGPRCNLRRRSMTMQEWRDRYGRPDPDPLPPSRQW